MAANLDEPEDAVATDMAIHRASHAVWRASEGIASAGFQVEMLIEAAGDGQDSAMRAVLDPGVVSHWHSHPHGQILYVLSGRGLAQCESGSIEEIHPGDCIRFAPGVKHWHGAATDSVFSYLSIQALQDGTAVHWLEPVTGEAAP